MDFTVERNHLPLLTSSTTRDQADSILDDSSQIYRDLVSRPMDIKDILQSTVGKFASINRRHTVEAKWGNEQHDKLFKLAGVKRRKNLRDQPFPFNICMSLLIQMAPGDVQVHLVNFVSDLTRQGINLNYINLSDYKDIMKEQTRLVKHSNSNLGVGINWNWFSDWDQFCGFNVAVPLSDEEVTEKVFDWCKGPIFRPIAGAPDAMGDYGELFRSKAFELFDFLQNIEGDAIDFKDWAIKTDLWVTSGSSRGVRVSVNDTVTGNTVASKNTKAVFAQTMTSVDIAKMMTDEGDTDTYSVAEKVEPGQKGRLIISAPLAQQLRMSYIDHYIHKSLTHLNGKTTIYMTSDRVKRFYDEMILSCSDVTNIHVPLDVSNFDHSVSKDEIEHIFDALSFNIGRSRILNCWRILLMITLSKLNMFGKGVTFHKKFLCKWERGLASGIKMTTFLGTIVNIVRFEVCLDQLSRDPEFGRPIVSARKFQGDDIMLIVKRLSDVVRIINWYGFIGVDVSPVKNFISYNTDEFLRKLYYNKLMTGYPARRMVKLCFRDPLKFGPTNRLDSTRATVSAIWSLLWRGCNYDSVIELIRYVCKVNLGSSIWEGSHPTASIIDRWLTTHTCLGGMGLELKGVVMRHRPVAFEIVYTGIKPSERYEVSLTHLNTERVTAAMNVTGFRGSYSATAKSVASSLAPEPPRVIYKLKITYPVIEKSRIKQSNISIFFRENKFWKNWQPLDEAMHLPYIDAINSACDNSDIDALRRLTHDDCKKLFDVIFTRCHTSVLYHWVKNTLPNISVQLRDTNDVVSSVYCKRVYTQSLSNLVLSKSNISYSDFISCMIFATDFVYNNVVSARRSNLMYFYGS